MKKAFIITSAIDVDNNYPLTYSKTRSIFSSEDRIKHTIFTINSLDMACDNDATLFLVDISDNYQQYRDILRFQTNLVYVSVKEEFPEIYNEVRMHPNKSYCETVILLSFIKKYKLELETYDYIFKVSGRYFVDNKFDVSIFNEFNQGKFFFKKPLSFEWNENWNYQMVDRRQIQGNNRLHQYSSVLYGFSSYQLNRMLDIYHVIAVFTSHPATMSYDVETLLYYFTRPYSDSIIETDWIVYGWDGTSGNFLRY